ncbi:uncharacterized protein V1510DRAFT_417172 [Dipodascopsis tothii]|uniref:uncharacterized protein n=1 Tax=Dipodascopsis tothii TaxID=44089 RepID=UPI0034CF04FE
MAAPPPRGQYYYDDYYRADERAPSPPSPAKAKPPAPQQDRYVCPVCARAFSRPSSLRIHSHSHTGEKPFVCSHFACGKAFSVRSNMKRHERGCHHV